MLIENFPFSVADFAWDDYGVDFSPCDLCNYFVDGKCTAEDCPHD